MTKQFAPGETLRGGCVGRAVFQSRDWKRALKGEVSQTVFINSKSPVEISVHILNIAPDKTIAKICDSDAKRRGENRRFYGWAELPVADASESGRTVRASPQPGNEWHANIVLPCKAGEKIQRERHANQLAKNASPRPRP